MRLVIADDHALFRDSLKSLLEARGIDVVGEASTGRQALDLARSMRPDLVLMDLSMPEMGGLEAIQVLTESQPEVRVVVLTASTDDDDLFEALRAGAHGYLLKNLEADTFFDLLDSALEGQPALTPELSRKVLQAFAKGPQAASQREDPDALTDRELEVLQLMVDGVTSNRLLAKRLGIRENTVKFHVRNILDKLHLHNRAQAVSHALRRKLVKPQEG
jgi:DNA-binding NarL/FixJ family response regulator